MAAHPLASVDCMSMFIHKMTPKNLLGQSSPVQCSLVQFDTNHIIFRNVEIFKKKFFFSEFFFLKEIKNFDEILKNISFVENGLLKT